MSMLAEAYKRGRAVLTSWHPIATEPSRADGVCVCAKQTGLIATSSRHHAQINIILLSRNMYRALSPSQPTQFQVCNYFLPFPFPFFQFLSSPFTRSVLPLFIHNLLFVPFRLRSCSLPFFSVSISLSLSLCRVALTAVPRWLTLCPSCLRRRHCSGWHWRTYGDSSRLLRWAAMTQSTARLAISDWWSALRHSFILPPHCF
jgi:hypothetical protein